MNASIRANQAEIKEKFGDGTGTPRPTEDNGAGFATMVVIAAIVSALAGFPGVAAAIVFGAIGLYLALLFLAWFLGALAAGIGAALRFPFVLLGRLLTGRGLRGDSTAQAGDAIRDGVSITDTPAQPQSREKGPIGWLRFILFSIPMLVPSFFVFYVGLGFISAIITIASGDKPELLAVIPEAVQIALVGLLAALMTFALLHKRVRWDRFL